MLADIIVHRSSLRTRLDGDDLHRHATFYCAVQKGLQRILKVMGLA